ncbi:MAG: WXG100 family type VII secretion target [Chloroflexi bacterium]|nr:WXG100 family type VII secretion target [Chloroflexota bacterium]
MANADKIQADYDQLEQIAAQFAQQGDQTLALWRQAYNCMSQLRDGGWIGVGANRFYDEMESLVLPGLERLVNALRAGSAQAARIAQVLRAAEEQAGQLFLPNGTSSNGVTGSAVSDSSASGLSGRLLALDVGRSVALSPLRMFENYIGADPAQGKIKKLWHQFSKRHLFGKYADGADEKFINRSVDAKVVLAGGELWSQRGALLHYARDFQVGALKGSAYAELGSYDTSGEWEASIGREGVKIGASFQGGVYLGRAGVSAEIGGLQAAGQAYVGAQAHGEAGAVLRAGQAYVGASGELFAGAKAEGKVSYTHQIVDGLSLGATASGYVSYGIGVQADIKFGYDEGKIRIGGALGATLLVGAGAKLDITIDAKGVIDKGVQTLQEVGHSIARVGRDALNLARSLLPQ